MPFKDSAQRRDYDKAYKRKQRARGWTEKGLDTRLTEAQFETAEDLRRMLREVWTEARDADDASLKPETRLRIQLRVIEVGLRLVETTDLVRRIAALEEESNESPRVES